MTSCLNADWDISWKSCSENENDKMPKKIFAEMPY